MKATAKRWLNFAFLFFTLGVVLYLGLNGNDMNALWSALRTFAPASLALCLLCWVVNYLADALSIHYFLRRQGYPIRYRSSLYISLVGIYYCNVTPGATGGQPMQIYRLKQYGVPIGISGSAMTIRFFCFQSMLLVVGGLLWLLQPAFVYEQIGTAHLLIWLGYIVNFFSIGMLLLMAVNRRAIRFVIAVCIRVGTKLRICKDPEKSTQKWDAHVASFQGSVELIRHHPRELLVQCLIATVQLLAQMSVVVCIYHAFGLTQASDLSLLTMATLLYISASYTPLPGASGAQEGGFALYFKYLFPDATLFVALMIWRFFTYYFPVLLGVIMTLFENVHGLRKAKDAPSDI